VGRYGQSLSVLGMFALGLGVKPTFQKMFPPRMKRDSVTLRHKVDFECKELWTQFPMRISKSKFVAGCQWLKRLYWQVHGGLDEVDRDTDRKALLNCRRQETMAMVRLLENFRGMEFTLLPRQLGGQVSLQLGE
jgi:hypothetical protein